MDSSPPPPTPRVSLMEDPLIADDPSTWEWGTLFDFSVNDDPLLFPWPGSSQDQPVPSLPPVSPSPAPEPSPASPSDGLGRIRKRDPRLVCSNFLAGRVPCACPELDAQEREEEEVAEAMAGARKRVRMSGTAAVVRCQVPGCEVDIRELKGYHRRHRVCLKCANAPSVVLDGEHKRYCQQCGK